MFTTREFRPQSATSKHTRYLKSNQVYSSFVKLDQINARTTKLTFGTLPRNLTTTKRTFFHVFDNRLGFVHLSVEFDEEEDDHRDYEKVDDGLEEIAVVPGDCSFGAGFGDCVVVAGGAGG